VATKLEVSKAALSFEAGFPKPEFGLLRDAAALLDRLYRRLEPYGLRLTDVRVEQGAGSVGDQHMLVHLFNYWMTIRVRVERIEVGCSDLGRESVERFKAATLDLLRAIQDYKQDLSFRAFGVTIDLHAKLEGKHVRDYLAGYVANAPKGLGPPTGNGVAFYFGAEGDRLLSTVTADVSALVPDGLFIRVHGVWDARHVSAEAVPGMADAFARQALESLELQLPV
jgi:hypothetical protein